MALLCGLPFHLIPDLRQLFDLAHQVVEPPLFLDLALDQWDPL